MFKNHIRAASAVTVLLLMLCTLQAVAYHKQGDQKQRKKQVAVLKMRDQALADLNKAKPETAAEIKRAAGYAVFDNAGIHLLLLATSRGKGVVVDNATGTPTYMKMRT